MLTNEFDYKTDNTNSLSPYAPVTVLMRVEGRAATKALVTVRGRPLSLLARILRLSVRRDTSTTDILQEKVRTVRNIPGGHF